MSTGNVIGRVGKFNISFRDATLSSHAGMVLVKEFASALAVPQIINDELSVKTRQRGYSEAEAVLGLVYNLVAGGDSLSDLEVLRGDPGTKELLGVEEIIAPQTAGEHLRKFSIGAIRDLQRSNRTLQQQVRPLQQSRPARSISIPRSTSKHLRRSKAQPKLTTGRSAITRCLRFGRKKASLCIVTYDAAVRTRRRR